MNCRNLVWIDRFSKLLKLAIDKKQQHDNLEDEGSGPTIL